MTKRFVFLLAIGLVIAGSVLADDNVRAVQEKLHAGGFYQGEIDGAYSSQLSAALTRYQIRNGLPITGQLDEDTSKALGAKAGVTDKAADPAHTSSETWQRLRKGERQTLAIERRETLSPGAEETTEVAPQSAPAATAQDANTEQLRDYVGAFVLAGLDPKVGSETEFFADHVQYYDQGLFDREKIRKDLQQYAARWPERRFWLDGDVSIDRQNGNRVRVTFPLRYDLRNGGKHFSGKVNKTLVLEPAGDNFQIVAVNERKSD